MRLSSGIFIAPTLMAVVAPAAMATVYLSPEQALGVIFPGQNAGGFKPSTLKPTKDQRKAITASTGLPIRDKEISVWTSPNGSQMYVDQVVGKHEFITFALGIGPDGKVLGVEILEYKETYGGEIRQAEWRKQFHGKKAGDVFKLGGTIRNISGATLSCHSVTDGVNRLLAIRSLPK